MALGDLRNSGSKSNSNKLFEQTYYSRTILKGTDGLRLGFSFKSGMIVVDITQEKDGFQYETLASCFLTPVKALTMYNQIQEFKKQVENKTYKEGTAFGVNTGIGDISTVLLIHQVDGNTAVTIGKVNSDGQYVAKFTYKFAKAYHYGITLSDIEKMVKAKADFEGFPLSAETIKKMGYECGVMCTDTSLDPEGVLKDIIKRVGDAL